MNCCIRRRKQRCFGGYFNLKYDTIHTNERLKNEEIEADREAQMGFNDMLRSIIALAFSIPFSRKIRKGVDRMNSGIGLYQISQLCFVYVLCIYMRSDCILFIFSVYTPVISIITSQLPL
ncbi:hypothetical protein ABFS82_04G109200 [Erythranthe guttata]